jgi:hypothetical protein
MAADIRVIFRGTRYLQAEVTSSWVNPAQGPGCRIEVGKARGWRSDTAQGFWRSFAEIDQSKEADVLAFVKRFGTIKERPDGRENASEWYPLQEALRSLAGAWEPPDATGLSVMVDNAKSLVAIVAAYNNNPRARSYLKGTNLKFVPDPTDPTATLPEAQNLAAFMMASAHRGLKHGLPMRRCKFCNVWFYPTRSNALFCSASCKTQSSNQQREERV